jgi:hypothetical protein
MNTTINYSNSTGNSIGISLVTIMLRKFSKYCSWKHYSKGTLITDNVVIGAFSL